MNLRPTMLTVFLALTSAAACRDAAPPTPAEPPAPRIIKPMKPQPAASTAVPLEDLRYQRFVLKPDTEFQMLLVGPPQTGGMRSGRVVLLPGQQMERHSTGENEEMLVFLKGTTRVVLGDETLTMSEGQALYVPPRTEHELHNGGTDEARYLFVVAPAALPAAQPD